MPKKNAVLAVEPQAPKPFLEPRPTTYGGGSYATTPRAGKMMALLGSGPRHASVTVSRDEYTALNKLYGITTEKPNKRPAKPEPPHAGQLSYREEIDYKNAVGAWEKWTDPRAFMQAGVDINLMRHAESDGLRLAAWLAKFVPAGEDPLKTLIQAVAQAGWDVEPEDVAYADGDVDGDEEDEE